MEQLDLFATPMNEMSALWEALEKTKVSQNKTRKRLFAEINDLEKELTKAKAEIERLKFHVEMKPTIRWAS